MKAMNWLLYESHRWLGILLALVMVTWFASGIVIMYSSPTTVSREQQARHGETLNTEPVWLGLADAWQRALGTLKAEHTANTPSLVDARLVRRAGEPLWLFQDTNGDHFAISAIDGTRRSIGRQQALDIARHWATMEGLALPTVSFIETIDKTVILRNRDGFRPFHRIVVGDGQELLISARTGDVLHASTRAQRALFYAGNWLHLFKPLDSIGLGTIRHDVQLWAGLTAGITYLTGLIIGWLRWRPGLRGRKTYSEGRTQPYRESWMKWHFWSGLIGGTLALSWAISGFISTNPGKWFSEQDLTKAQLGAFLGETSLDIVKQATDSAGDHATDDVERQWRRLGNELVMLSFSRDGHRQAHRQDGSEQQFSKPALLAAAGRITGGSDIVANVITEYDAYYYPRHHQTDWEKPLPVIHAQINDAAGTELYIDPKDGRVLAKLDRSRRVYRWLYSALHHWDFGWLYNRPLWDLWILSWVGFGLVLSASSVVIGWRRLNNTLKRRKRREATGNAASGRLIRQTEQRLKTAQP